MITHSRLSEKLEMQSQQVLAIALLGSGGLLLFTGLTAADTLGVQLSKIFAEPAAEIAMWITLCGVALLVTGVSMSYSASQKSAM